MADILEKLNDKQREAVLETEGYVRVIAGAGSGKTKLLVSRYAYLVQEYGIDTANILCVTFTNKAAGEMKRRIRALIGEGNDTTLICTYHGFCNRLLRENPEKLFLNKQFQIIDAQQQKAILSEIYQKLELKLDYASFESILHRIGFVKSHTDYVPRMCDPKPCQIMLEISDKKDEIVEEFLQRQKATYSLDFHDLIAFAIHVLEHHADVRDKWQNRLNYIMVDEFQDSSAVEMRLVELLSDRYRNLMIVGDPDQNIYEWRGSKVELLVDFDKMHEPTRTIILDQNYRSTPQILKCANSLIEKNKIRLKKDLFTKNPSGSAVTHYHSKNDFEEMDQVIGNIKRLRVQEGFGYSDFAILYRSSFLSRIAEKKLVEKNIPYEIFGGVKFYQRMEILDVLAYLKLIAYDDDSSFRRIVNTPRRRFGRAKMSLLEELKEHGSRTDDQMDFFGLMRRGLAEDSVNDGEDRVALVGNSLFATLRANLDEKEFKASDAANFVKLIEDFRKRYPTMRISDIVNEVTKYSGYESYIRELGDEERLDNLAEFKRIANEFEREFGEDLTLEEFLQQIALQSGEDSEDSRDSVKLMTIHSSKGLEFPVVFILGFTEGVFPSSKTIESRKNEGLEEERRLCYVAMTRAEKYLFLMDSEGMSQNGMKKLCSRFLDEIGEENYTRVGRISEELKRESRAYAAKLNRELVCDDTNAVGYRIGAAVTHHIFGNGVIQGIDESRGSYIVKFDGIDLPRNITKSYFEKEHEDVRGRRYPADAEEKTEEKLEEQGESEQGKPELEELEGNVGTEFAPDELVRLQIDERDFDERSTEANMSGDEEGNHVRQSDDRDSGIELIENLDIEHDNEGEDITFLEAENELEESNDLSEIESRNISQEQAERLKELKENSPNLWKHPEVPHTGWNCVGVDDLGAPVGICEMCGYQIIRYAHHMEHPDYRNLVCGCVCAGKMEGDIEGAKRREAEFKNRQSRRVNFFKRKWRHSRKGNEFLKIDGHIVVLYHSRQNGNIWKYSIDNEFCGNSYSTRERAVAAAFDALEEIRGEA